MTTYNADASAGNEVIIRKIVTGLSGGGTPPPTTGQIWPRGQGAPR